MPLYYESYWISGDVYDAFKWSYLRLPRSQFRSHHMPLMLLFLPLQQCEKSEGGPPCNSMPLVRLGLTMCVVKCSYFLSAASYVLNKAPLCLGSSRQSLKAHEVRCIPGDPTTMCPALFKGSRSPLSLAYCCVAYCTFRPYLIRRYLVLW